MLAARVVVCVCARSARDEVYPRWARAPRLEDARHRIYMHSLAMNMACGLGVSCVGFMTEVGCTLCVQQRLTIAFTYACP